LKDKFEKLRKTSPYLHNAVEAVKMQAENKQIEIVIDEEENLTHL
jgi:hypothetical protein